MSLYVKESFVNVTKGYSWGDSGVYETRYDRPGELYWAMQGEYGRCTGKVYRDRIDGSAQWIGWVFQGRARYEDARGNDREKDFYLREVWVTVHERKPETTVTEYLADLG